MFYSNLIELMGVKLWSILIKRGYTNQGEQLYKTIATAVVGVSRCVYRLIKRLNKDHMSLLRGQSCVGGFMF